MKINEYGKVTFNESEIINFLYQGNNFDTKEIFIDEQEVVDQFNKAKSLNADRFNELPKLAQSTVDLNTFDRENQKNWFLPKDYCPNLIELLYGMCNTQEEKDRVSLELELFVQHNMVDLLYYLKYLVDTMRNNKIVWGVGRGSSVSSYVLYLLGVHKINSLEYQLDIHEFIK